MTYANCYIVSDAEVLSDYYWTDVNSAHVPNEETWTDCSIIYVYVVEELHPIVQDYVYDYKGYPQQPTYL